MERDKIDEILQDIDKSGFGLPFSAIPDDKKAAFTKATSLGYLDIDPGNNYCLSRVGQSIVNSGLSYREWEAKNSKPDGTGRLDDDSADVAASEPVVEEKPVKRSWLRIFGFK